MWDLKLGRVLAKPRYEKKELKDRIKMAEGQGERSQFLIRFSGLPVVNTALGYATNTYSRVKDANPVILYTLTTAEKSVPIANKMAQPIVKRLEKQISFADGIALKGLEKLEEKFPLITKPTEMIVQDTKNLYNTTLKTGYDSFNNVKSNGIAKVNAVKDYGFQTAVGLIHSSYGKFVTDSVNGALSLTENYVEYILPPLDEADVDDSKETEVLQRVANLTNRLRNRIYRHAVNKAQNLRKISTVSIQRYGTTEIVTSAYTNATWLWEELNKEPQEIANASLNDQILNTARFTTRHLVSAFVTAKTTILVIPSRINGGLATVYNFAAIIPSDLNNGLSSLYNYSTNAVTYVNNINPQEVAAAIIHLKDRLRLQERVSFVFHTVVQNRAIQWVVNNPAEVEEIELKPLIS